MTTAQELKIRELYHYQKFDMDWLNQTINHNIIYLSNPGGFNDPWDCRPHFHSDVDDPQVKKEVIDFYVNAYNKAHPSGGKVDVGKAIEELNRDTEKLKGFINKTSEGIAGDIDRQYRVYCLTENPCCVLTWGHYADKHTGVCLEFNVPNDVFSAAEKIFYEEEYPPFQFTDDSVETNVKALTTKSMDWSYESEYRLIALDDGASLSAGGMLVTKDNLLPIPDEALKAVIVGCLMPKENKDQIEALIKASGKAIKLKQAVRFPGRYGLSIS